MFSDILEFLLFSQWHSSALQMKRNVPSRAANAIFGKIGRLASEEFTLHLFFMDLRFFN